MKKILFLAVALIMSVGAWAQTLPIESGVYEIENVSNEGGAGKGRGWLVDYTGWTSGPSIGACPWTAHASNHPAEKNSATTCSYWYLQQEEDGTYSMFSLSTLGNTAAPRYLKVGTDNANNKKCTWSSEKVVFNIEASVRTGNGEANAVVIKNQEGSRMLSMACGSNSTSGSIVTDTNTGDGGTPLYFRVPTNFVPTEAQVSLMEAAGVEYEGGAPTTNGYVTSLDQLSNNKVYVIRSYRRGWWTAKDGSDNIWQTNGLDNNGAAFTSGSGKAQNAEDPDQQWAILTSNGHYYLYNIGQKKFFVSQPGYTNNSTKATLSATVSESDAVDFEDKFDVITGSWKSTNPEVRWGVSMTVNSTVCHFAVTNWNGQSWQVFQGNGDWSKNNDEGLYFAIEAVADIDPAVLAEAMNTLNPAGPDWDGLAEYIEKATSYTIGEGLGQYTAGEGFEEALAEAQMIMGYHEGGIDSTKEGVQECIDNLKAAIAALSLNMPKAGQLLRIKDNEGNYMTCKNASNKSVFKAEKDVESIYLFTGNELIAYSNGFYASRAGSNGGYPCGMTQVTNPGQVGVTYHFHPSTLAGSKGKYFVTFGGDTRYMYQGANAGTNPNAAGYEFTLEEVTELPVAFHADGKGYATLYSPVALDVAEGVKAYTVGNSEKEGVLSATEVSVIPANTGVILEGTAGETVNFTVSEEEGSGESVLSGTFAAINKVDDSYVFSVVSENPGFYMFEGATLAGFKAYYVPTTTPNVQGFVLNFGEQTTGIISVNENANASVNCFDLAGRRVNANVKGISIVNGKKIVK